MGWRCLRAAGCVILVLFSSSPALQAQHPVEKTDWSVEMIRRSGQLVAPVFEGHYQNPDGTHTLVFGYHSLNTNEAVDVPLGSDNFIDPIEYDGMQPTHFDPVPENGARRHWGVFTVVVPEDFGDQNVVWNLRHRGHLWSIPGHLRSPHYLLDAVDTDARDTHAAVMKFEPDGQGWRGTDWHGLWAARGTCRSAAPAQRLGRPPARSAEPGVVVQTSGTWRRPVQWVGVGGPAVWR